MTKEELFAQLFPLPYNHAKWLEDQAVVIERLKTTKDEYFIEQANILQKFQDGNQCSPLMLDILVGRIKRYRDDKLDDELIEKALETKEKIVLDNDKEV